MSCWCRNAQATIQPHHGPSHHTQNQSRGRSALTATHTFFNASFSFFSRFSAACSCCGLALAAPACCTLALASSNCFCTHQCSSTQDSRQSEVRQFLPHTNIDRPLQCVASSSTGTTCMGSTCTAGKPMLHCIDTCRLGFLLYPQGVEGRWIMTLHCVLGATVFLQREPITGMLFSFVLQRGAWYDSNSSQPTVIEQSQTPDPAYKYRALPGTL